METLTLLTCRDAAARIGISERAMRHLFDSRTLPLVRLGSRLYVTEADLLAHIRDARVAS